MIGKSVNCGFRLGPPRDQGVDFDCSGTVGSGLAGKRKKGMDDAQRVISGPPMRREEKAADSRSGSESFEFFPLPAAVVGSCKGNPKNAVCRSSVTFPSCDAAKQLPSPYSNQGQSGRRPRIKSASASAAEESGDPTGGLIFVVACLERHAES